MSTLHVNTVTFSDIQKFSDMMDSSLKLAGENPMLITNKRSIPVDQVLTAQDLLEFSEMTLEQALTDERPSIRALAKFVQRNCSGKES